MSAPILLSTFLKALSGRDFPPEVEEHRIRLRRISGETGSIERHLQKWADTVSAEHSRQEQAGRESPHVDTAQVARAERDEREDEVRKAYLRGASELARVLEETNHRILGDAPSLDDYEELIQFFKERRVYTPEPFPAREFVRQDEHANEEYRQLIVDAMNLAVEKARTSFTPEVKHYNRVIALLGLVALNSFGISIFFFQDNPLRLSIGLLVCFDTLLAIAYIFFRMSRSKEDQLRAHIQHLVEIETGRARAEIARREDERYKQFLEEERERREAWEKEQEKKRAAFDRAEAQRLDQLQPLLAGKTPSIQGVLSSLLPLRLPVPCEVSCKVGSAHTVEVTLQLPDDRILPPELRRNARRPATASGRELQELLQQCTTLAASLAIRYAAEIMFNVPTCNTVVVNGLRMLVDPDTRVSFSSQVLHAEIDRKNLGPMGRTVSPLLAIKRFKHRFSVGERQIERNSA